MWPHDNFTARKEAILRYNAAALISLWFISSSSYPTIDALLNYPLIKLPRTCLFDQSTFRSYASAIVLTTMLTIGIACKFLVMYNIISAIASLFQKPQDKKESVATQTEGMPSSLKLGIYQPLV